MNLRQLQCFVAVAEAGGFRQAAARLHLAQPALSRQIQAVEGELGIQLFDRTSRRVKLTAGGEAFLRGVRAALESLANGVERARRAGEGELGRCVLAAALPALSTGFITRAAERIAAEYPGIDLTIVEADLPAYWRLLREGDVDLVVGLRPPPEITGFDFETLWREPLRCALVSARHSLAQRERVRIQDLLDETYLTLGPAVGPVLWDAVRRALENAGVPRERMRIVASMNGLRTLVAAGRGWALLSERYLEHPPAGTVGLAVEDISIDMDRDAIWRAGDAGVVRRVVEVLREVVTRGDAPSRDRAPARDAAVDTGYLALPRLLDLRQLEYFRAATDLKIIAEAAEQLGIAQSVLSRQLRDLERAVGADLLQRGARGVHPTPAGGIILREARQVVEALETARQAALRASRTAMGQCIVATITTPLTVQVIAGVLGECTKAVPALDLEIVDLPSLSQPAALLDSTADVGFGVSLDAEDDPRIEREHMLDDPIDCAIVSQEHPAAGRGRIRLDELADLPFLFARRESHPVFHDRVLRQLRQIGLASPVDVTYQSLHLRCTRAAAGKGWCLGFRSQRARPPRGTATVSVDGLFLPWGMDLLWRRDEDRAPVLELIAAFRRAAAVARRAGSTTVD